MNKYVTILFIMIFCSSCANNAAQTSSSKINDNKNSIVIINATKNKKYEFKYFDYFGRSELVPFPVNDTLRIKNTFPIVTYSTSGGNFSDLSYYTLNPGDTISIAMKKTREVLSSNNKNLANRLALLQQLLFNVGSRNYTMTGDFNKNVREINNYYLTNKKIIDKYKYSVDSSGYQEAKASNYYDRLASTISLHSQYHKKYDSVLTALKNADTSAWNCLTFRNVMFEYNYYVDKVCGENAAISHVNYIRKHIPSAIQDFVIFYYLTNYKPNYASKLDTLNKLTSEFYIYTKHKSLANNLNINLRKYNDDFKTKESNKISLSPTNGNGRIVSLDQVLNRNKGKLIYLDFWASWCAPCLAEMPYSFALSRKYGKEKASVVFIYLSKDENMAAWQDKVKQLEIPAEESFIVFNNDAFKRFCKKYDLKTIPRYMIIGRTGEMIDIDALRPSEHKLEDQIDRLLENDDKYHQPPL